MVGGISVEKGIEIFPWRWVWINAASNNAAFGSRLRSANLLSNSRLFMVPTEETDDAVVAEHPENDEEVPSSSSSSD